MTIFFGSLKRIDIMTTVEDAVEIHVTALQDRDADHLRTVMLEIVTHLGARGVLQLTPQGLCNVVKSLVAKNTLSSDDRQQVIRMLKNSLWCGGWLPSSSTAAAFRYPLLPLDMSADAPPFAAQLPPGNGRLYLSITECERGDALLAGECGGGTVVVNIPLLSIRHTIPFYKNLTSAEVMALCRDSYVEEPNGVRLKFAIVGGEQLGQCWTGPVSVNAELHCVDCHSTFDVLYVPEIVDEDIMCLSCNSNLSLVFIDESYYCCFGCEGVICEQCMEAAMILRSN